MTICLIILLRSVTSFLLSHIGLLSLVVGYCIMGAFIFQELERANEIETKREMKTKRLAMTDTLWDITKYKMNTILRRAKMMIYYLKGHGGAPPGELDAGGDG